MPVAPTPIQSVNVPSVNIPTHVQYSSSLDEPFYEHGVFDVMTQLPGQSIVGGQQGWMSNPLYEEPGFGQTIMPIRQQHHAPITTVTPAYSQMPSSSHFAPSLDRDYAMAGPSVSANNAGNGTHDTKGVFRPSQYVWESALNSQTAPLDMEFRTTQFRK